MLLSCLDGIKYIMLVFNIHPRRPLISYFMCLEYQRIVRVAWRYLFEYSYTNLIWLRWFSELGYVFIIPSRVFHKFKTEKEREKLIEDLAYVSFTFNISRYLIYCKYHSFTNYPIKYPSSSWLAIHYWAFLEVFFPRTSVLWNRLAAST